MSSIRKYIRSYSAAEVRTMARDLYRFVLFPRGRNLADNLKQNWKSGVTVSLVNVPLSVSLATASGASPEQGIATAFWGGLIAALFGGSQFNIVGPTGALSGLLSKVGEEEDDGKSCAFRFRPTFCHEFSCAWCASIAFFVVRSHIPFTSHVSLISHCCPLSHLLGHHLDRSECLTGVGVHVRRVLHAGVGVQS
jgi:hypothetical protein